jgi:hypothetical protein
MTRIFFRLKKIVIPAKAGIQGRRNPRRIKHWIPAFAGMTPIFMVLQNAH